MKVFKLIGTYDWPLTRKFPDYVVILLGPDRITSKEFTRNCKIVFERLKKKYGSDDSNFPYGKRLPRKKILDEAAKMLCRKFGFKIAKEGGKHTVHGFSPKDGKP